MFPRSHGGLGQGHAAKRRHRMKPAAARSPRPASAAKASLPTALERDTLLMPDVVAEDTVAEAARYLGAALPGTCAERLVSKAEYLYGRHSAFQRSLKRSGDSAPAQLRVYFRHWLCSWLKRNRRALFNRLPWGYALGHRLPAEPPHALGTSPKCARHAA